jgi:ATP/maltotriose-dependent transcriptional regulator MalT
VTKVDARPKRLPQPGSPPALLTTKLTIPPVRAGLVARPRLTARLEDALCHRVTLLASPPGYGKTTLLSAWLAARGRRAAWLALDEHDNDPVRFWTYLCAALERAYPGSAGSTAALLRSVPAPPTETLLAALVEALTTLEGDLLLVLDDIHLVTAQPVRDALAALAEHLPPRLHLVLASRADPALPLARLRARGELLELRAADLRFMPPEASAFLADTMGLRLAAEDAALLAERTEGWPTGLQLAALAMRAHEHTDRSMPPAASTAGSQRFVLDYLLEEVLDHQPEELRRFVLRASILDRITPALCDALTEAPPGTSATLLRELVRGNVFLTPLDDAGMWYRFHALFADALRQRLDETEPGQRPILHARARDWLAAAGELDEAVRYAIAAGDMARAGALADDYARALWNRSELGQLQSWIDALPAAVVQSGRRLRLYGAWAHFATGDLGDGGRLLDEAERAAAAGDLPAERRVAHGALLALRGFLARCEGDNAQAEARARQALAILPEDEPSWRSLAAICLGHATNDRGDLAAAYAAYEEAARIGERVGDAFTYVSGNLGVANIEQEWADPHTAHRRTRAVWVRCTAPGAPPLPILGLVEADLGGLAYEWNQLDEAERHARSCLARAQRSRLIDLFVNAYLLLAAVARARGDHGTATQHLDAATEAIAAMGIRSLGIGVAALKAQFAILRGDLTAAERWAASPESALPASEDAIASFLGGRLILTTHARLHIARGRPEAALSVLETLLRTAERTGQRAIQIEASGLRALAHAAAGNRDAALDALEHALRLARPGGYLRTFLDDGAPMRTLLGELRETRCVSLDAALAAYLDALLGAFARESATLARTAAQLSLPVTALPCRLTPREYEVLALVAAGASNADIAAHLTVSLHTVKTHLAHIFGKLGAASRTQALARAREQGLV